MTFKEPSAIKQVCNHGPSVWRTLLVATALLMFASAPAAQSADIEPPWAEVENEAHDLMATDPPRWSEARRAFEAAAALGSSQASSYLGWMYENGHGVAVDQTEAVRWYAKVANAGVHEYAVKLGWMYLGNAVGPDRAVAEGWFRRAIAAEHLPANVALASVLIADALGGKAVERISEARQLLETALAGDERLAAFFLARIYIEGIGGHPRDDDLAAGYARIGADDGHPQMQGWLALMYLRGQGVEVNPMESAFWAALAAAGGDPLGRQLHQAFEGELSADDRKLVLERTFRWAVAQQERS